MSLRRLWRRLRGGADVDVIYSRRYAVDIGLHQIDPKRGHRVLGWLSDQGWVPPRRLHRPDPVTFEHLRRVHTDGYLESLQRPGAMTAIVGHHLDETQQDAVLDGQRAMVGGTLDAVRRARRHGRHVMNLGGGLHHATAERGQGFCVFNDVAVAVAALRAEGLTGPVLIVDLDLHDGEGTRAIFADDETVHTYSLHNRTLAADWEAARASTTVELGDGIDGATYLAELERTLPPVFASVAPELVIYLAGADIARDDLLGNWFVDEASMVGRDRRVVELARAAGAPLAVCLAGGYGRAAWRHAVRTWAVLAGVAPLPDPPSMLDLSLRPYRKVAQMLHQGELTAEVDEGDTFRLDPEDLMPGIAPRHRLLGFYSRHGIELALERYGVFKRLKQRGFDDLHVEFDLQPTEGDRLRVSSRAFDEPLIEVRLRRDRVALPPFELLFIEWLQLQNPAATFSDRRPRLPGQRHPGLGTLREVVSLLVLACERLELDGLGFIPAAYHLAARTLRRFVFADPWHEARFRALRRALSHLPLNQGEAVLAERQLLDENGAPVAWEPSLMILPVSDRLTERYLTDPFEREIAAVAHDLVIASDDRRAFPAARNEGRTD